jgi:hypothetical protein
MEQASGYEVGDRGAKAANPTTVGRTFREVIFNFQIEMSVCKLLIVIMVTRQWESVGSLFGVYGSLF